MRRGFIKFFLLTSVVGGAFIHHLFAADHASLSGIWALDVEASRFGASVTPVEKGVMTISVPEHKLIRLEISTKNGNKERTVEHTWKVDDRYHPVDGSIPGEVIAKWEGGVLVGKKQTVAGVEEIRFRLTPDRESLTESIASGSDVSTLIWRRQ